MKRLLLSLVVLSLFNLSEYAAAALQTPAEKLGYAMGVMTGKTFKDHQISIDPQTFAQGLNDGYHNKKTALTHLLER